MRNNVVHRLAGSLLATGRAALRFDFRGVGRSEGAYDEGRGERDDLVAALAWLRERTGVAEPVLCGYSFGALVAAGCASAGEPVDRMILAGLPPRVFDLGFLSGCALPTTLIQGSRDEHGGVAEVRAITDRMPRGELRIIEGADHFFTGRLDELGEAARVALATDVAPGDELPRSPA